MQYTINPVNDRDSMIFAVLNFQSSLNINVLSILIPIHIVDNMIDIMYAGNFSVSISSESEL
ncbi:hypothetical protein, partial [Citrobacter freundii]|uniref:hypothetical protein n=1 Tax=Citrobacter freundii TaxID=546 RepID=UPI003A988302